MIKKAKTICKNTSSVLSTQNATQLTLFKQLWKYDLGILKLTVS